MSKAVELTSATFDESIGQGVTLVDFWAEWCGPCKMLAPIIDELTDDYEGRAKIAKIDVDSEGELAQRFSVSSIPSLIVFKDGEETNRFIGVTSKADLAGALDAACA